MYTDTGAAVVVQGASGAAIVAQCRLGPCGWWAQSKAGYAVLTRQGGHASVLNSDLYRLSQSGVVAYQGSSSAYVNRCRIGPCLLSAVAAEGTRVELQASCSVLDALIPAISCFAAVAYFFDSIRISQHEQWLF